MLHSSVRFLGFIPFTLYSLCFPCQCGAFPPFTLTLSWHDNDEIGRSNSISAVAELRDLYPHVDWRLVAIDVDYSEAINCRNIIYAAAPATTVMDFNIATAIWFAARGYGILEHNPPVALPHTEEKV